MAITFVLSDEPIAPVWQPGQRELANAWAEQGEFAAWDGPPSVLCTGEWPRTMNGLCCAAREAFVSRRPLVIAPDDVWLAVLRVVADHITREADSLRDRLGLPAGKQVLVVAEAGPDPRSTRWPPIFAEFSKQIAGRIGSELRDLLICDFSTTGPIERAASEVMLMDAVSSYFAYEIRGLERRSFEEAVPVLTLLGTVDDWQRVHRRASQLVVFGMDRWLPALLPFLEQFARTANGDLDLPWWRNFFHDGRKNGRELDGHLRVLFPKALEVQDVLRLDDVPSTVARVPVAWRREDRLELYFWAGTPFAVVLGDGAVAASASWGVEVARPPEPVAPVDRREVRCVRCGGKWPARMSMCWNCDAPLPAYSAATAAEQVLTPSECRRCGATVLPDARRCPRCRSHIS